MTSEELFDVYIEINSTKPEEFSIQYEGDYIFPYNESFYQVDELVSQLDKVIKTASFKQSSKYDLKKYETTVFDKYVHPYVKYKSIISHNCVFFPRFIIFQQKHLSALDVFDDIAHSTLLSLKLYREYNFGFKINAHDTYVVFDGQSDTQFDVVFVSQTRMEWKDLKSIEYIIANRLFDTLNHNLLKIGGYMFITIRSIDKYIFVDILKYLSTIFKKIYLTKSIYNGKLSYYKHIICEHYMGNAKYIDNSKPISRLYDKFDPYILSKRHQFYDEIFEMRNQYYNEYLQVVDAYKRGDDISAMVDKMQNELIIRYMMLYNLLGYDIPIFIKFNTRLLMKFLMVMPQPTIWQFEQPSGKHVEFHENNHLYIKSNRYKLYLDSIDIDIYKKRRYILITSNYLKKQISNKLNISISQAFLKITEIINEIQIINKDTTALHICEAPGQFILGFDYYCRKHGIQYDWKANSLNPSHKGNFEKFGEDIISDAYGLIRNHPDKWIWGPDNSGDITKPEVIKELTSSKYDIITSDCGLPLFINGKLNTQYYEVFKSSTRCILGALKEGGSCIFKVIMPVYKQEHASILNQFYLSFEQMIFFKPSLNESSSEFYAICINYKPTNTTQFDYNFDLYNCMNTFINIQQRAIHRYLLMYYYHDQVDYKKLQAIINDHIKYWISKYL